MAEGLTTPPDACGLADEDTRVGPDGASGDCAAVAPGGRFRDRRSGVALLSAGGSPADGDAALLEAARATPRRSSIIKVSQARATRARSGHARGCG